MRRTTTSASISAVLTLATTAAVYAASQSDFERIPPNELIILPADVGTTNDVLGKGFSETASEFDAAGKTHRIYPAVAKETTENRFDVESEIIDNQVELAAHARLLFARAGVRARSEKRYVVLRVFHVNKVATLQIDGEPQASASMVAHRVYYGRALYWIIEGDQSSFTAEAAAELVKAGGAVETVLQKFHLTKHLRMIGLTAKEADGVAIVTDPEQVEQRFKVSNVSVPIFVEYRVLKDIFAEKVGWAKSRFSPGQFRLRSVKVELSSTKADGRPWDALNGPPDPFVTVFLDGTPVGSCLTRDVLTAECALNKIVTISKDSSVTVHVVDKDLSEDDDVGDGKIDNIVEKGAPYEEVELETTDQLTRAAVVLVPVSK